MKKLLAKVRGKKQPELPASRITTDTLAEHREQVLAGGRKFKYPVQYQRHRLVINTIIIGLSAVLILLGVGWYMLYPAQNSSEFMYRVTKVIPVPVAVIDGQQVAYSDYLMKYRSAVHYLTEKEQVDVNTEDGKRQLTYVKTQSMNDAIADAYTVKLARTMAIEVTSADLETFLKQQRQSSDGTEVSETTYNSVIQDYYGWSPDEYRDAMKNKLLRQKVAFAVDEHAKNTTTAIEGRIKNGQTNLQEIADALNADAKGSVSFSPAAWVPKNNRDGGLATAANSLQKGQISSAIKTTSGDGYYYVQLLDKNDAQLQYTFIHVPLTTFDTQLASIEKDGKLAKFITVEDTTTQK
jgi:hypothetical protein